jgi:hypothetical protein
MKRTPFARQAPAPEVRPERIRPVARPLARAANYGQPANDAFVAVPKREYIRSPALLAACQHLPCMHCGRAIPGTVCAAHSNWADWGGKGGHIKADDNCIAALCDLCHIPVLDQGAKLTYIERRAMWLAAHLKTVAELVRTARWPAGIPIPTLTP